MHDLFFNNDLYVINSVFCPNVCTHYVGSVENVLDLGICNDLLYISNFEILSDSMLISDHYPILVYLSTPSLPSHDFSFWNLSNVNWIGYQQCLSLLLQDINIEHIHLHLFQIIVFSLIRLLTN